MNWPFANSATNDSVEDLPPGKLERAMAFRNGLVALCQGRSNMDDAVYRLLRREFMGDPAVSTLLPSFVRTVHDTAAMWAFLKGHSGQWEPRRQFVRDQFASLIDRLEAGLPQADVLISDTLTTFDAEGITDAWNRALARRDADPAGAITAARTLLETVCKHLLEDEAGEARYGPNDDLPKLYRLASERLNLAPSQHTEETFRRILGGATSVVEGLGSLRNKVGDAHGQGRRPIKPAARHAGLAVNLAGSMAVFLIETASANRAS